MLLFSNVRAHCSKKKGWGGGGYITHLESAEDHQWCSINEIKCEVVIWWEEQHIVVMKLDYESRNIHWCLMFNFNSVSGDRLKISNLKLLSASKERGAMVARMLYGFDRA